MVNTVWALIRIFESLSLATYIDGKSVHIPRCLATLFSDIQPLVLSAMVPTAETKECAVHRTSSPCGKHSISHGSLNIKTDTSDFVSLDPKDFDSAPPSPLSSPSSPSSFFSSSSSTSLGSVVNGPNGKDALNMTVYILT